MLESKQSVYLGYWPSLTVPEAVRKLTRRAADDLIYLVTPENSDGEAGAMVQEGAGTGRMDGRSIAKVAFWVGLSITMSLLLGQLN